MAQYVIQETEDTHWLHFLLTMPSTAWYQKQNCSVPEDAILIHFLLLILYIASYRNVLLQFPHQKVYDHKMLQLTKQSCKFMTSKSIETHSFWVCAVPSITIYCDNLFTWVKCSQGTQATFHDHIIQKSQKVIFPKENDAFRWRETSGISTYNQ